MGRLVVGELHPVKPRSPTLSPPSSTPSNFLGKPFKFSYGWSTTSAVGDASAWNPEHQGSIESERRTMGVPGAHCDFKKVDSGGGDARRRACYGEVLAATFLPELEENGSDWSYKGLEHVVRGSTGS